MLSRLLILIFLLSNQLLIAQTSNVLILGKIKQVTTPQVITIEINKRYINNSVEEYTAGLTDQQEFGIACRVEIPQLITFYYGNLACQLFVEPNDTLRLTFEEQNFPQEILFEGKSQGNNIFWQNFSKQYPTDPVLFHYNQYRKGTYYYKIHRDLDKNLRGLAPEDFVDWQQQQTQAKQQQAEKSKLSFTPAFEAFLTAEIKFREKLSHLAYCHIYGARHQVDSSFMASIDSNWVQNDAYLGNFYYREFLLAWLNYKMKTNTLSSSSYIDAYYEAEKVLKGRTKYFTMAQLLAIALRKNPIAEIKEIYEHFLKENPYYELDKLVLDPFQKASSYQTGKAAPDFKLKDKNGQQITLHQFRGKVIYLDFWASWCRPCLSKQSKMQAFEPQFDTSQVIFIHVCLDKNFEQWKSTVEEQQLTGVHLFYEPTASRIVQDYEVYSVPKFFLITTTGNFAYTPSSFSLDELSLTINRLLNR